MDPHPFASLAHVRILLIPVGLIPQASYETFAQEIRSFETLRLGEIPADTKDDKGKFGETMSFEFSQHCTIAARFLPSPLSKGNLHLNFPTHPPPRSHSPLSLLRPSHFPMAVIGVASCSQIDSLKSLYSQFNASLSDIFSPGGVYPLVKNCFVFEETEGTENLDPGETFPGLIIVPRITNRKLHIGTLLGVICSQILAEFGVLVRLFSLLSGFTLTIL